MYYFCEDTDNLFIHCKYTKEIWSTICYYYPTPINIQFIDCIEYIWETKYMIPQPMKRIILIL